jgi:pimeloyl-ACP methyl ester carboxylesterase
LTKNIYVFSGLGADERMFSNINFCNHSVTYIRWILPDKNEPIENYVKRLLVQIPTEQPILIGLSFGGMIAIEVAKQIKTEKVILIASAKTKVEIPFYYRWMGGVGLNHILPTSILKHSNFVINWLFGAKANSEKQLLKSILSETDPTFLMWAIDKIVSWKNITSVNNVFHIHGTSDRILPFRFVTCDYIIKNGNHFMTQSKAGEVSKVMKEILT